MSYITFLEYEDYTGLNLGTPIEEFLTDDLIPDVQNLIEKIVGYSFEAATLTKKLNPLDIASGRNLFLPTWLFSLTSITLNGIVIDAGEYIKIGTANAAPYWKIQLKSNSSESWFNFGDTPEESLEIAGTWGFSSSPPRNIKKACYYWIQGQLKNRTGTVEKWRSKDFDDILDSYPEFMPFA